MSTQSRLVHAGLWEAFAMAPRANVCLVAAAASLLMLLAPAAAERKLLQGPFEDCAVGTKATVIPESQRCGGDRNGCCQVGIHDTKWLTHAPASCMFTSRVTAASHTVRHIAVILD